MPPRHLPPATPNERSMLAKLRTIWNLAEADSQWAETAFNEDDAEEDAAMDSVQARMETVRAAARSAAEALQRRSSTWSNESLYTPPDEHATQLIRDGGRFSDHQSGLIFSSIGALIDWLADNDPQELINYTESHGSDGLGEANVARRDSANEPGSTASIDYEDQDEPNS